jgi:hypothetical protein
MKPKQLHEDYPNIVPKARRLLQYGADKEGYWTEDRFMEQVKNAADIADIKQKECELFV